MDFIRQSEVIQWKDGDYKTIKENSVDDEYTYLFIDYLPPRKFSTYPKESNRKKSSNGLKFGG